MKRWLALILVGLMAVQLTACQTASGLFHNNQSPEGSTEVEAVEEDDMRIGFLFPLGADAPDTTSHVAAIRRMQQDIGLRDDQVLIMKNVSGDKCSDAIEKLAGKGCDMIVAKSIDAEDAMVEAAKNHPEIEFCQEDGRKAADSGLPNMHNFYVRLYQAYYVAGVAAGVKLNEMLNHGKISSDSCVIGFAATRKNPENISCINAFHLGVKQVCSQASMLVRYVGKSGNYDADGECARQLIAAGAHLMCQRVFTNAVAVVCAENDIPVIGNETNIIDVAPNEAITSAIADWSVYYKYAADCLLKGQDIDTDWCAGYKENAVLLSQLNDAHLADGTIDRVMDMEKSLRAGKVKIFDTTTFTVDGKSLEDLVANNSEYKKYKPYVTGGQYRESKDSSVPTMEFLIDGISESTDNYLPDETAEESTSEDDQ